MSFFFVDLKSVDDKGMFLYVAGEASDVSISRLDDSDITKVISYYCLFFHLLDIIGIPTLCSGV